MAIATRLIEEETLDAEQFESLFVGMPPHSRITLSPQPVAA
jgi:hypothetical protein